MGVQTASSDATIYGTSPSKNWSSISYLTVASGGSGRRAYVYFNSPVPLGATVSSAKLRLTQQRAADVSATRLLNAEPVAASWQESKITWNNAPGVTSRDAFAAPLTGKGSAGRVIEFDVTDMMQDVANGAPWYGFRITSDNPNVLPLYSRESGVGQPSLEVVWSDAPRQPTKLAPAGGRAVSIARPTLSFDFTDMSGATGMGAYQVQVFKPGATATVPSSLAVKVASFNVNGGYNGNWATRLPMVVSLLAAADADIILLQEAHEGPGEHMEILAGLHTAGRTEYVMAGGSGGNFIILNGSTLGVAQPVKRYQMPHNRDASTMKVVDLVSGAVLGVWNTHLIAGDQPKRADQMRYLLPIITALGPSVGGGDLNNDTAFSGSPLQQSALAGVLETRGLVEDVSNGAYNSYDGYATNPMQGKWVDHLFVSGGPVATSVGLTDSGSASDHNLIWTEAVLASTATPAAGALGAPWIDTGQVSASVPLYALTSDLAVGDVVWWRARVADSAGLWSAWSDTVPFTRVAKPVVTVTNPAAVPDNFVSEPTPPFSWTADGQVAYRLLVTDAADQTSIRWDSGKVTSADQVVTPSTGLPLTSGRPYRLVVRVYDAVAREATPGDPVYAEVDREFTYNLSTTVAPVASLTARQADERPWVTLEWSSATAPDGFVILRDGHTVHVADTAVDLLVSGTTYQWVDREVSPQEEHTWQVRRIVNHATSADNPSVSLTTFVTGAWVCTPDGERAVVLAGERPVQWDADELVDLYRPYGGTQVHIVTGSVFGRAGNVAGSLQAYAGQTFAAAKAELEALRDRDTYPYGTPLVLTLSDTCTRIFWYGVVRDERDEFSDDIGVRFDFCEIAR